MTAVWMRVGSEVAARKRGLIAIALMIGVFGATSLAAAAGARRTSSSVQRFLDSTKSSQIQVGNALDQKLRARVEKLPQISSAAPYTFFLMVPQAVASGPQKTAHELIGASLAGLSFGVPTDDRWTRTIDIPRVIHGRMPDPARSDEIVLNESLAEKYKVRVSDTFTFRAYSLEQLYTVVFGGKNEPPSGPVYVGKVVGIVRHPLDLATAIGGGFENAFASKAFYEKYAETAANFGINLTVRVRGGARGVAEFIRTIESMAEKAGPDVELFAQSYAPQYAPASDAARVQAVAIALFSGLMALAMVLVLGQSLSRSIHGGARDYPALRALGMSRRELFVTGLAPAAVAIASGMAIAALGAALASTVFPVGFARRAEPHPGFALDATAIAAGAGVLVLLLMARCALAAWRAASLREEGATETRPSALGAAVSKAGLPTSVAIGARMALAPSGGRASVSVRAATLGAVVALAAMTAGLGIATSIHSLVETPRYYGANWDVALNAGDDPSSVPGLTKRLSEDPTIGNFSSGLLADVFLNGRRTQSYGVESVRGNVFFSIIEGRRPRGSSEIALGTQTMRSLKLGLGDDVTVKTEGASTTMKIVGRIVLPGLDDDTLGDGAAIEMSAFKGLKLDQPHFVDFPIFLARFKPGVNAGRATRALIASVGKTNVSTTGIPPAVANLKRVQDLPPQLADLLLALAVATIAHTVITSVRERRRDIAILKTLGFVRRQAVAVVSSQSTTFMIVALLFGIPLGYAAANWSWTALADHIGVVPAPSIETAALAIYGIGVLVAANLVAAWPARAAARSRPANVLRTE
jgi:putative ABC transport system permease protein